jgi:hypothetical protein
MVRQPKATSRDLGCHCRFSIPETRTIAAPILAAQRTRQLSPATILAHRTLLTDPQRSDIGILRKIAQ